MVEISDVNQLYLADFRGDLKKFKSINAFEPILAELKFNDAHLHLSDLGQV